MTLARALRSDPLCHDDVRPFNIWGLRLPSGHDRRSCIRPSDKEARS